MPVCALRMLEAISPQLSAAGILRPGPGSDGAVKATADQVHHLGGQEGLLQMNFPWFGIQGFL